MKILQFTKKGIVCLMFILFTLMAQFTLLYTFSHGYNSYAYSVPEEDILQNPNFEQGSSSSSGNPYTPTYWTSAGGDENNVSKGIIDTTNKTFNVNNSYGLSANPLTSTSVEDKEILMINSKGIATRFGYKNTTEIDLKANKYYSIAVLCKTNTLTNGASIYLTGSDLPITNQYHFVDVTTGTSNNGWETFTFYVKTNTTEATKAYLELWLGSRQENNTLSNGQVFFDNIIVNSIDQTTFNNYTKDKDFSNSEAMPKNVRLLDLTGKEYSSQFENSNFENATFTGWEKTLTEGSDNAYSGITIAGQTTEMLSDMHLAATEAVPGNNFSVNNTKALYINHGTEEGTYTQYTSTPITIKQHSYAMITYYSKTGNVKTGGANAIVKMVSEDDDAPSLTVADYTTTATGLANYNNYALTTIYVEGNPYKDVEITLSLGLGKKDAPANGYVIFDDIKVYEISNKTYSSATSNVIKLYKDSDTVTITNGAFNFSGSTEASVTYPIKPKSWTLSNDISGIINVNKAHYEANANNYGPNAVYPGPVVSYPNVDTNPETTLNNMLMLRNDNSTSYATATSTSFTAEQDIKTIAITVYVKVQANLSNPNSGAYITLKNGNNILAQIGNITVTEWTAYTIYFKNANTTLDLQLELSLGTAENPTSGYAYFDNILHTQDVADDVLAARNTETSVYTNLETNNFDSYIYNKTGVHTPTSMKGGDITAATIAGVINTSSIAQNIVTVDVPTREGSNNNLLMIKNNAPTFFTYSTNFTYTFAAGSHYVVDVWMYTANLSGEEDKEFGVNLALSNVEKTFSNVAAKADDTTNEKVWTKYSFYVSSTSESAITSNLSISLGSDKTLTQGYVFVDTIAIKTLTADEYNEIEEDEYTIKTVAEVKASEENTEEEVEGTGTTVDFWVLSSTLILVLALVIAVIGMAMRKINFRLPRYRKKAKVDYSREHNLNTADIRRELQVARQAKVKELDKQIAETKKAMDEAKHAYEESIKDLDNEQKVEKLFTKYAKQNKKYQVEIDNFESAKKYITNEANIKLEEQKEIRRRELLLEEENRLLKQNQAEIEKEKQKEKLEQEAKVEAGKKKARLKSKQ